MGGQQSKVSYDQLMSVITNVIATDIQNCASYIKAGQEIDVVGSGNIITDITMVQGVTIRSDCVGKKVSDTSLQNKVKLALDQYAKNVGLGGLSALDRMSSKTGVTLTTNIHNNITIKNVQNCVASIDASQKIKIKGGQNIVARVAMEQTLNQLKSCLSSSLNKTGLSDSLSAIAKQAAETETKNPIAQVLGTIGNAITSIPKTIIWVVFGFIVLVVAAILVSRYMSRSTPPVAPPIVSQ